MNGRERVRAILRGDSADRVAFWPGNPAPETKRIYCEYFGIENGGTDEADIELAVRLDSDLFWCSPEVDSRGWNHPEGRPMFDGLGGKKRESLSQPGILADCEDPERVEELDWPNPDYLDFTSTIETIERASERGMAIFGGMWAPFFHVAADFFGMENYFMKMRTHPQVVEAVTEKVLDFYLEANRRCFEAMAEKLDAVFFGNDLGSQRGLLVSPTTFEQFVLPGYKRIVDQAKEYGLKTLLHSCGGVSRIIPSIREAGVEGLHPLQALAKGMDADSLADEFKGDLVFIGGVDTQQVLPFGTPDEVTAEVRRLKSVFGERFIVSPSHEALLPNVSIENVLAMRDAALET